MAGLDDIRKQAEQMLRNDKVKDALRSDKAEGASDRVLDAVEGAVNKATGNRFADKVEGFRDQADKHIGTDGARDGHVTDGHAPRHTATTDRDVDRDAHGADGSAPRHTATTDRDVDGAAGR